jgi:hypothetical protein
MFSVEPEGRVIRRDSMPAPDKHQVKRWQILIAGAGQMAEGNLFGRSIIADARLAGKYLGPHAVALTFPEPGGALNLWTYAFLNTSIGLNAVKACAFGTSVPGLRLDLLGEIPIPIPRDDDILNRVANLVRRCVKQRDLYLRELQAARQVIEGLSEMREAHDMCVTRKARCTMWSGPLRTMSAWNAASTGGALGLLRGVWKGRLGDVVTASIDYGPRFTRIGCRPPHGIEFLTQRDVFRIRPLPRRIAHPGVDGSKIFVRPDAILVAAQGTLGEGEIFGKVMLARGRLAKVAYTGHVLRLLPKEEYASTLFSFLSTFVGLQLLRSTAVGTKLLSMREDMLRDLPIPQLNKTRSDEIVRHVDAAFTAREEATDAELEAIHAAEETVSLWLN